MGRGKGCLGVWQEMDVALLFSLFLERMEEKTLQIVLRVMGGKQLVQVVVLQGEEKDSRIGTAVQHVRMFQIFIGDYEFTGGKGLVPPQEDLLKASFQDTEDFDIIVGVVVALPGEYAPDTAHACPAEGALVSFGIIKAQQGGERRLYLADVQSGAFREA